MAATSAPPNTRSHLHAIRLISYWKSVMGPSVPNISQVPELMDVLNLPAGYGIFRIPRKEHQPGDAQWMLDRALVITPTGDIEVWLTSEVRLIRIEKETFNDPSVRDFPAIREWMINGYSSDISTELIAFAQEYGQEPVTQGKLASTVGRTWS